MRVEHVAFQLPLPLEAAAWWCEHLGFRALRSSAEPPYGHFLVDSAGQVILETYRNDAAPVPDYHALDPLVMHLAFVTIDITAERDRLLAAGATLAQDVYRTPTGDQIAMLRDPWGFPLQLVARAVALR